MPTPAHNRERHRRSRTDGRETKWSGTVLWVSAWMMSSILHPCLRVAVVLVVVNEWLSRATEEACKPCVAPGDRVSLPAAHWLGWGGPVRAEQARGRWDQMREAAWWSGYQVIPQALEAGGNCCSLSGSLRTQSARMRLRWSVTTYAGRFVGRSVCTCVPQPASDEQAARLLTMV
ncbi:hypothetical protein GGTG_13638 [Gaeumannomyces tritici R3-111a-1]|uniref:Uncharacterized protein n=1 Tax=Gaeumannomyces tritici (strain R3-111a-1) TaxID=644352 RepID=J3PJF7_GAET3|nr:hypothetical protein GGTG_13638 [Gaeumannomyces tritici R3-111a-1]EJT68787.1 hypothetical protein GGTG_13638 [Gaeumannomyces tritici R3-111a-1]